MKRSAVLMGLMLAVSSVWATLITDDFNRADTACSTAGAIVGANWVASRGAGSEWKINSSNLCVNAPASGNSVLYNSAVQTISGSGSNFTLRADVAVKLVNGWSGVAFNYQDASNYYIFRFKAGTTGYQLLRMVNGVFGIIVSGNAAAPFAVGTMYTLTVSADRAHTFDFTIMESGKSVALNLITSGTDTNSSFTAGYAGLYNGVAGTPNPDTVFDNFSLQVVPEQVLQAGRLVESTAVTDSFEARRDAALEKLRGRKLVIAEKREPLQPGRGAYTRHFGYSIVNFAMKSLWLNDQVGTANEALQTYGKHYIADTKCRNDRDSFYWPADTLCRIVEFYGQNGSMAPGRLSAETEDILLEMMWLYAKENSKVDSLDEVSDIYKNWNWSAVGDKPLPVSAELRRTGTWDVIESENHDLMKRSTLWHFAKFLAASPKYRERKYDDGHTAAEHFTAFTEYAKEYCRQRAQKGLFVEMADEFYNSQTLKCLHNYYDFSADKDLCRLAGNLITLYYACWAQEQIDGVRGGGKSRMYADKDIRGTGPVLGNMWYYAGLGMEKEPSNETFTILTSGYRLPPVVVDLAADVAGRGNYEIQERPLGLATNGYYTNPHYRLRTDFGGIVRYSYCTPDFIMGLPMVEARPKADWTLISSQSRWQGVIFAGNQAARIFPQCQGPNGSPSFNQQWGVQRKGTMISQRLPKELSPDTGGLQVWVGHVGLGNRVENAGWVFAEATGAYAAVRPARGGYAWTKPDEQHGNGAWMTFSDGSSPAIIEVAQKKDFKNYEAFQQAVVGLPLTWKDQELHYTGLSGDEFTFYSDCSQKPKVNDIPIDYAPGDVFKSKFIISKWDSGLVVISKGDRTITLDF